MTLLHGLMTALNREIAFDTDPTHSATTAAEAFALRRGVCQDLTHIFIAAARQLGIPARYVGGHFCRDDGVTAQDAGHAWAEAYIEHLGWVGFDPTNGIGTTEAHVRVAIGSRLPWRGAGARHAQRRQRRNAESGGQCRPGAPAVAKLTWRARPYSDTGPVRSRDRTLLDKGRCRCNLAAEQDRSPTP